MKIAIIGAGNVGGTLGTRWAHKGHEVAFGSRNPDDSKIHTVLAGAGENARAFSVVAAVAQSEIVVLTLPWEAVQEVLCSIGDLSSKVLIDATNPVEMGVEGLKKGLVVGHSTSGGEQVAAWTTGARVVKAFNSTGYPNMADPAYDGVPTTMFVCGDDADAKTIVAGLGEDLGFEMWDAGPLVNARLLEPLAMLWIDLAFFRGLGPNIAFKLLKR